MSDSSKYWNDPPSKHTLVKSEIICKYFPVWANIVGKINQQITYLDLFTGRGEHKSGDLSTALKVIKEASRNELLKNSLQIILNDKLEKNVENLKEVITRYGFGKKFRKPIIIANSEVNALTPEALNRIKLGSTFCFIDPYGYKGLTFDLIKSVTLDWGCDCVLFFDSSGINRNFGIKKCQKDIIQILGESSLEKISNGIHGRFDKRENAILAEFRNRCIDKGIRYFLPLQFNFYKSEGISHHLVFLSKHYRGFGIMKDIMAGYSQTVNGIPKYVYIEGREKYSNDITLDLDGGPMSELKKLIISDFGGHKLMVKDIVESYHVKGLLYPKKSIKDALLRLEHEEKLCDCSPNGKRRNKKTLGDSRIVQIYKK